MKKWADIKTKGRSPAQMAALDAEVALAAKTIENEVPLPNYDVPVYSFWEPFGSLAVGGIKTIETRGHEPPKGHVPGWIGVCTTQKRAAPRLVQRVQELVRARAVQGDERAKRWHWERPTFEPPGRILGLLYIAEVRPLVPEDEPAALFYEAGRSAWCIGQAMRFEEPLPISALGWTRAPQNFVYVPHKLLPIQHEPKDHTS